jgi:hypothetical protein
MSKVVVAESVTYAVMHSASSARVGAAASSSVAVSAITARIAAAPAFFRAALPIESTATETSCESVALRVATRAIYFTVSAREVPARRVFGRSAGLTETQRASIHHHRCLTGVSPSLSVVAELRARGCARASHKDSVAAFDSPGVTIYRRPGRRQTSPIYTRAQVAVGTSHAHPQAGSHPDSAIVAKATTSGGAHYLLATLAAAGAWPPGAHAWA